MPSSFASCRVAGSRLPTTRPERIAVFSARVSCECSGPFSSSCRCMARSFRRSEEHTSELQSLMRNSYAVFCLNKQNAKNKNHANLKLQRKYENCSNLHV